MQQVVYKCDSCKKEIGSQPHISLMFSDNAATGIAVPPAIEGMAWKVNPIGKRFVHFHNAKCIGEYFDTLIKKSKNKNYERK